jgi:hypothetical protein
MKKEFKELSMKVIRDLWEEYRLTTLPPAPKIEFEKNCAFFGNSLDSDTEKLILDPEDKTAFYDTVHETCHYLHYLTNHDLWKRFYLLGGNRPENRYNSLIELIANLGTFSFLEQNGLIRGYLNLPECERTLISGPCLELYNKDKTLLKRLVKEDRESCKKILDSITGPRFLGKLQETLWPCLTKSRATTY